jgi:hypothetical protein
MRDEKAEAVATYSPRGREDAPAAPRHASLFVFVEANCFRPGCQSALNIGSDSMLVQFVGTLGGTSKENRRHGLWALVGTVWARHRTRRNRNGQTSACGPTDIEDGGMSDL